jgi:hypothetical protein
MNKESKAMLDWLREWIAQGPGVNPVALAAALEIVVGLSQVAPWGAPKARLNDARQYLRQWFTHQSMGMTATAMCKQQLYDSLWLVEYWWDRPQSRTSEEAVAHDRGSAQGPNLAASRPLNESLNG